MDSFSDPPKSARRFLFPKREKVEGVCKKNLPSFFPRASGERRSADSFARNEEGSRFSILLIVAATTALGIALRIWWIANVRTEQRFDFASYYEIAANIAAGRGHTMSGSPVAWQGSAYPYALAAFFRLFGVSEWAGKVFNVILSSLSLILSYFTYGLLFGKRRRPRLTAFVLTALWPPLIAYNSVLGTEIFFSLATTALLTVQLLKTRNKLARFAILGVVCGICALTKPFMLAYPIIVALIEWTQTKKLKDCAACLCVVSGAAALVIAPWTIRNYRVFGAFIPVSYNSGYCLFVNNNAANTKSGWMDLALTDGGEDARTAVSSALANGRSVKLAHELDRPLREAAVEWIKKNPAAFLQLGVLRIERTFFAGANDVEQWAMNGFAYEGGEEGKNDFARFYNSVMAALNMGSDLLAGAAFLFILAKAPGYIRSFFRKNQDCGTVENFVIANMAFFMAVVFVYEGQARYAFPTIPFMIAAAAELSAPRNPRRL